MAERPDLMPIGVGDMAEPTVSAPRQSLSRGGVVPDGGWEAESEERDETPPPPAEPMFSADDLADLGDDSGSAGPNVAVIVGVAVLLGLLVLVGLLGIGALGFLALG